MVIVKKTTHGLLSSKDLSIDDLSGVISGGCTAGIIVCWREQWMTA